MSEKFFVGLDVTRFEDNGKQRPISRVTLMVDDNKALTAGDDTGTELVADCPHATQEMVNAILANVKGYQYQMFSAGDAGLDPSAEFGDGITVGGIYSIISRIDDDGNGYPSVAAPGEAELEDEYPASGPMSRKFDRDIAETRSRITKTAYEIRLEVQNELNGMSAAIDVQLDSISSTVNGLDGKVTALEQTDSEIKATVWGQGRAISTLEQTDSEIKATVQWHGEAISTLEQTASGIEASVSDLSKGLSQTLRIAADGVTITNAAGSTLSIDGGQLKADSISFDALNSGTQDRITGAESTAASAASTASSAYSHATSAEATAKKIANGEYRGTFIDGKKIYAPEIYAGTGEQVISLTEDGMNFYNQHGFKLMELDKGSDGEARWMSPYGVRVSAPWIRLDPLMDINSTADQTVTFRGTVDFSNATVIGLGTGTTS